jgi:hypothetical protein
MVARSDSAGATHAFAAACRTRGVWFSFGFPVDTRIQAIVDDIPEGLLGGQTAGLEVNHRQHARLEDRIREAKSTGLRNFPCRGWEENQAWLQALLTTCDLVCRTKVIGCTGHPMFARAEIATQPHPARRRPHHPQQQTNSARPRPNLGLRQRYRPSLVTTPHRLT